MAVDTETKRRSALGMVIMALAIAPVPDGTIAAVDREHIVGIYAGIAPAAPVVTTTLLNYVGPVGSTVADYPPNHVTDSGENLLITGAIEIQGAGWVEDVFVVKGIADGGLTNYDLKVGDTITPDYGMVQIGNSVIGRTSYKVGNIDLDGAILLRNIAGPITGEIEFIWTESTGNTCRFALPKSGVGNATYNSRSMLLAGPAPADTDFVKVTYWQGQGIFDNLACDTSGAGADLGVQHDLEVENDIFTDNLKESTPGAGIESNKIKFTSIGGFAISLTNNTGSNSVEGQLVEADDTDENSYKTADANATDAIGTVYNAGIADGSETWIVVTGIAEMLIDAGGCVHHDRLITSATAGSADVSNAPAVAVHFQEVGHAIETVVGAGLAKVVLHFN